MTEKQLEMFDQLEPRAIKAEPALHEHLDEILARQLDAELTGPYRFRLVRHEDETGVSGTGLVADGAMFSDGHAVLRWRTKFKSTTVYASMQDVEAIHGHQGKTHVEWIDPVPGPGYKRGVNDAQQDFCEGCAWSSLGGPDIEKHCPPHYVQEKGATYELDYIRGYMAMAHRLGWV